MNAVSLSLVAASFGALGNYFFRKSSEYEAKTFNGYLLFFYLLSLLLSFCIYPNLLSAPLDMPMLLVGASVGVASFGVMAFTGQALKRGPAGLTFAFQNVSSIFPALVLFILFGPEFGFQFSLSKVIGISLVLVGLFLGIQNKGGKITAGWIFFAFSCFAMQIMALSLIQWRCLLFDAGSSEHCLIPFRLDESADAWFMPGQFGAAFILQLLLFISEKRSCKAGEAIYGSLGGMANGAATFFLLLATKWALPYEKAMLFPIFASAVIILCNLWASRFYKEKFHLPSNAACCLGIIVGSIA